MNEFEILFPIPTGSRNTDDMGLPPAFDPRYRWCSSLGCAYKEARGSKQGAFWQGKFVCDDCYNRLSLTQQDTHK